jgi:hypothetical protein
MRATIPGAFVECGVGGGGSSLLTALTLKQLKVTNRWIWLYDTFAGMANPSTHDVNYAHQTVGEMLKSKGRDKPSEQSCHSLYKVQSVMDRAGYPSDRIMYVEGDIMKTVPKTMPDKIALLRLDTDWYKSTKHELEHLYGQLVRGGILIIDDYGHWKGCRKAVDEFFKDTPIFFHRIDYTGRIAIKP